ncbi:MAG: Rossmann-like domain-containing protein [Thermodesulfobacteriota bacterium]
MNIYEKLFLAFEAKAKPLYIDKVLTGLSYTAVKLSNGNTGIAYTNHGLKPFSEEFYPENTEAINYLFFIKSQHPLKKSIGIALINALNHDYTLSLHDDDNNTGLFTYLDINSRTKISMAGFIKPLADKINTKTKFLDVLDYDKKTGCEKAFLKNLKKSDYLIITSSSLLNSTLEPFLKEKNQKTKAVLIGPTAPMSEQAFKGTGISLLAGSHIKPGCEEVVLEKVAKGFGTPVLKKFLRKTVLKIPE